MTTTENHPVFGSIVVGVDESEHGRRALSVGVDLAKRLHIGCHVVHAWNLPSMAWVSPFAGPAACFVDLEPGERSWLAELLAGVTDKGLTITGEVKQGLAGPAIVEAAGNLQAALIVVGSVGHGALVGTLLGSVSEYCVHHASCPVVVVPPEDREAPAAHDSRAAALTAR